MLKNYKVHLNKSNRDINISVYEPKLKDNMKCLYLLDGQNAFKDTKTMFNRSLRLMNIINYLSTLNVNIMAIGIESNHKRNDEYSPFKIISPSILDGASNDISYCHSFSDDVINDIIPFIENKYNITPDRNNRIIYGSSLGAIESLYLGLKYDAFNSIGAFSTASFIYDNDFNDFILSTLNVGKRIFIYVGEREESDSEFKPIDYLNSAHDLKKLLDSKGINNKLVINRIGEHNEKSWSYFIPDFLKYIFE